MDRETLRTIGPDQYKALLEERIYDEVDTIVNISKGHSKELHADMTHNEMLQRVVRERKDNISSFYDEELLKEAISDAIYYKLDEVSTWMTSERYEFDKPQDFQTFVISLDMGGEPLGSGFEAKLKNGRHEYVEKESSAVKLVLQRSLDDESPFGFFLKTAYVDIGHKNAKETGTKYTSKEVALNENVKFKDNWEKLYYVTKESNPGLDVNLKNRSGEQNLALYFRENEEKISAFIDDKGIRLKSFDDEGTHNITYAQCMFKNNRAAEIIRNINNVHLALTEKTHEIRKTIEQAFDYGE